MLKTLRQGDTGREVFVLRCLLDMDELSDVFDERCTERVKVFQKAQQLTADGIVGAKTWTALADTAPTVSTTKNRYSTYASAVQALLDDESVKVDGIYGAKTKAAVKAYQSANGLTADGIVGRKTWRSFICGESAEKILNECVYYCQWDKRWKNVMYSNHNDKKQTIGNSGCGPTSAAMILATWIDPAITPVETCADAQEHGYRTYSSGTSWGYFKHVFEEYSGFAKYQQTGSLDKLKAALKEGALAVCSMNSNDGGFWTKQGHFITVIGYDDTYIYALDPNKTAHPRRQELTKFKTCMKQAFIYWRQP